MTEPVPTHPLRRALPIAGLLLSGYVLVTLSLYIHRMPWLHEEPRRAIIAQEMILTGNYVAPTVFQHPYFKKPPLHNWILALAALPAGVVTPQRARLVSLGSFLLLAAAVYLLTRSGDRRLARIAFLVTLTNYLMLCEYGNMGQSDMLLALLTFVSYCIYMRGPLRFTTVLLSSVFMGLGILTKGLSPLFFYPAVLLHTLLEPDQRRRRLSLLAAHFALAWVLPAVWGLMLAWRGELQYLLATSGHELLDKTHGSIWKDLRHVVTFPVRIFVVMLPWSLVMAATFRRVRPQNALYRTSLYTAVLALAIFTFLPGSRDRYLIPAIPFFAIVAAHHIDPERILARRTASGLLLVLAAACVVLGVLLLAHGHLAQGVTLVLTALIALTLMKRTYRVVEMALLVALVALNFYEHGLYYLRAQRLTASRPVAAQLAASLTEDLPILVEPRDDLLAVMVDLEGQIRRPVHDRYYAHFAHYYLITDPDHVDPQGVELLRLPYRRARMREIVLLEVGAAARERISPAAREEFMVREPTRTLPAGSVLAHHACERASETEAQVFLLEAVLLE